MKTNSIKGPWYTPRSSQMILTIKRSRLVSMLIIKRKYLNKKLIKIFFWNLIIIVFKALKESRLNCNRIRNWWLVFKPRWRKWCSMTIFPTWQTENICKMILGRSIMMPRKKKTKLIELVWTNLCKLIKIYRKYKTLQYTIKTQTLLKLTRRPLRKLKSVL